MPILGLFSFFCDSLGTRLCAHTALFTLHIQITHKVSNFYKNMTAPDIHFIFQTWLSVLPWQHKSNNSHLQKWVFYIICIVMVLALAGFQL